MASMASTVVLQALTNACSQDPTLLKKAEDELKSWETQPGFYATLMSIYVNHSVDVNVRWLAVVCLKNGVDRYWRNALPKCTFTFTAAVLLFPNKIHYAKFSTFVFISALSEKEKIQIKKNQLLCTFNEPVQQCSVSSPELSMEQEENNVKKKYILRNNETPSEYCLQRRV